MAQFVPGLDAIHSNSAAEMKVLRWLRDLDADWTVLHSVGLVEHESKPWAEADLVLVGPRGVLVLEVKGGRIERRDGMWGFRDRWDRITWKREGPWDQAGGAAAALRRHLLAAGVIGGSTCVHWGVLLPDVEAPGAGPDVNLDVTIDGSRRWGSSASEVRRLFDYWGRRYPGSPDLDAGGCAAVVQRIRGDLSLVPLPRLTASRVAEHQSRLTQEQEQIVQAAGDNDRLLVSGRAGCGKSALAVTTARALRAEGRKTALIVYNSALARRLNRVLTPVRAEALTVDALALRVLREHSAEPDVTNEADWAAVRRNAAEVVLAPRYDALVIDEAQDLDTPALDLLDRLLVGGLRAGVWRTFLDQEQDIFDRDAVALWAGLAPARLRLTRNCRSTKQIASATSALCRILLDVATPVNGPEVTHAWFSTTEEHDALLGEIVSAKAREYGSNNVLVVGRRHLNEERRSRLAARSGIAAWGDPRSSEEGPFLATTSSVKGLESTAVVVHGVDDLVSVESRQFLYTACSRASVDLTVLLSNNTKRDFTAGGVWLGGQLASMLRGSSS